MTEVITAREIKMLEFDQIRRQLAAEAVSPMGRDKALGLEPAADYAAVLDLQNETAESRLLSSRNAFALAAVDDIAELIDRALKGAMLAGPELAAVMFFTAAVHRGQSFFKNRDHAMDCPLLYALVGQFTPLPELFSALQRSLDRDGNILDTASPELADLRRKIGTLQDRIREKMDEYIRSNHFRRYLQEALITIRNNRFVVPVRQEYRQNLEGVVHDQSASGATLFIEPMPVVRMQNELTALKRQEERERARILQQLSGQVAVLADELLINRNIYGELDLIAARGRLALKNGCAAPLLLDRKSPCFFFDQAVHPLLSGEKVPLNVELGEDALTLVVTGPNTGGKTVALKTIGLLALMAQCGLQLPAGRETRLAVFKRIRADIGDEQSIAQSLSTFSGHMRNIIAIVAEAASGTLVLFDELGAGTDPSEGSALAMAILDELTGKGALTVATTHINELKLFAQAREKMQNAAMEFNPDTQEPTYRLLQGIPGQSNAFHIAAKLGLPAGILEKAKSFLHRAHDQVEAIIAGLVADRQRFARDSHLAALERSKAELLMEELEKERDLLRARREDLIREAREEARRIVKKTKSSADELIKELQFIKEKGGGKIAGGAETVRQQLNLLRQEIEAEENDFEGPGGDESLKKADLSVGLAVYIPSLKQKGEVLTFSGSEAQVRVGTMKVSLPLHELKAAADSSREQLPDRSAGSHTFRKELAVSSSIDLRGLTAEEARPLVDKLLDNALWAGLSRVDIIHGRGTGKLKEGLRDYLKDHRLVRNCRSGKAAEGGEGVTVVEIRT